ncbi:MAG: DUF1501 domain-containing protein [Myxococcales bacterium]|nr:DUF1501 domain-containing protein [Myxococcales bacterium]
MKTFVSHGLSRRSVLGGALAALGVGAAGGARAAAQTGRRFLVVNASGGWDPLCVFSPLFGRKYIDMEPLAEAWTIGGLSLVDHPGRPSVRQFFTRHHQRALVLNGVGVRSVNHETCAAVVLTGSTSDEKADWATLLAHGARGEYDLPHVVLSGPVFPGPYGVIVSRAEGALAPLVRGDLLQNAEPASAPLPAAVGRRVDRFVDQRVAAVNEGFDGHVVATDLAESWQRARRLLDDAGSFEIQASYTLATRGRTAIRALSSGLCRCATVDTGFIWDTHQDNAEQIGLFESFFAELDALVDLLDATPGPTGAPLSDDTVLVVLSEMARTPIYNGTGGRDHWPYTSMMLLGNGISGDRVAGAYDDGFIGIGVDPATGELDPNRVGITAEEVGATLLALGDVDPGTVLPSVSPLTGLLA